MHYLLGAPGPGAGDPLWAPKLHRLIPLLLERDVFLCGPEPMMMAAELPLRQMGVPPRHIHHESFAF